MADLVNDLIARAERLKSDRTSIESHWSDIRQVIYPSAAAFVDKPSRCAKSHHQVFDSSGEQSAEMLAAALHGMMTNPATVWATIRARREQLNQQEDVALWLQQSTRILMAVFNSAEGEFASQQHEKYMDLVTFGTAGMFIDERPGVGPIFQTRPLRELLLAENQHGRIDTVYRWFNMSARAAWQAWGTKAGEKVASAAQDPKKQDETFEFLHATYPRTDRIEGRVEARHQPVASVYVNISEKHGIRQGGYPEMPWTTPRWYKRAGETYGRGPGMKALADVKMLQRAMQVTIRGTEKLIDPPLMVSDDGVLGPVRMTPAGLNVVRQDFMRGNALPIRPVLTGARPDLAEEFMASIRQRVQSAFYNHLLSMNKDPRMTATQVIQIAEETLRILGPTLGRLQSEDLGPMIWRVFNILLRAGAFPPVPQALVDEDIDIEYVSPIAKAQRLTEAKGIAQTIELVEPFAVRDPTIYDNFDGDKVARHVADLFGWPKDTLRPLDGVAAIRKGRQEVTEQQAQKADMLAAAQAGAKLLPAMAAAGGGNG